MYNLKRLHNVSGKGEFEVYWIRLNAFWDSISYEGINKFLTLEGTCSINKSAQAIAFISFLVTPLQTIRVTCICHTHILHTGRTAGIYATYLLHFDYLLNFVKLKDVTSIYNERH